MTQNPPILRAQNLTRHYDIRRGLFGGIARIHAASDISFTVAAGETLAVVGESGSGKSTVARMVTMIETPSHGDLHLNGINPATATKTERKNLRRDVQIVFQDPYGSLNPRQTIGAALAEPLLVNTSLSRSERNTQVREMMARVGLRPELQDRYPHMFSGGQRQRIAIARALMLRPKILVLDEPVSALDVSIRAQVLNLLAAIQREFNLAYVFISHDLSGVRHIADKIMVMYLGRVVEMGASETIFTKPQHPYTKALLSATPIADPTAKKERIILGGEMPTPFAPPNGCAFHPRCPLVMPECSVKRPELADKSGRDVACFAAFLGNRG
ncbi:MAG: dipeptide ABC transporter ATP-binding protein [Alphaproteobacteria bacterium]|nr:dipeptide ABC transporter ATP-binding protein [Alphaproteobacteria bacterium]